MQAGLWRLLGTDWPSVSPAPQTTHPPIQPPVSSQMSAMRHDVSPLCKSMRLLPMPLLLPVRLKEGAGSLPLLLPLLVPVRLKEGAARGTAGRA